MKENDDFLYDAVYMYDSMKLEIFELVSRVNMNPYQE